MKETIIKGTGNSRTLGSVPNLLTLYPTYEAFAAALAAGEVPVDIGPLNPAGVAQMGDALNKQTLLKDSTAALFGLPNTAVPDEVLAKIKTLIDVTNSSIQKKTAAGYYTGNGNKTRTIPLPFTPKGVLVMQRGYNMYSRYAYNTVTNTYVGGLAVTGKPVGDVSIPPASLEVTTNGFIVRSGSDNDSSGNTHSRQTNTQGGVYHYIAIG